MPRRFFLPLLALMAGLAACLPQTADRGLQTAEGGPRTVYETPVYPTSDSPSTPTPLPTLEIGSAWTRPTDGMVMVYVPAGEFIMGSPQDAGARNEQPQHTVYLDAFWMDQTEVTNAMFQAFVDATGYQTDAERMGSAWVFDPNSGWTEVSGADWRHPRGPGSGLSGLMNHPVVQVSWNDAAAYCAWAGARLPTEAEWEKAARGTNGRTYPWGEAAPAGHLLNFADVNLNVDRANRNENDGYPFTAPVGSYPDGASPYGVLDMAGNVWEWVADWYDPEYYSRSPGSNPSGPSSGDRRVLRGGSWYVGDGFVRVSYRYGSIPGASSNQIGFRCSGRAASP